MIEVAKLDSNDKVENTFSINRNYGMDATGTITQEKVEQYCIKTFGAGTYIANLSNVNGEANKGSNWNAELKCFHPDLYEDLNGNPCTSWRIDKTIGDWVAPHQYETTSNGNTYSGMKWSELTNRWYAKKTGEMTTWYRWNPSTNEWEDQTDI